MYRTVYPRRDAYLLPEERRTAKGSTYSVYHPRGKAIQTVVLVNGMTISGENDSRLVRFARACANAGLHVVIPHLPGLKQLRVRKSDMAHLLDVVTTLTNSRHEKVGLIGFSTGGSYALLLAAKPQLQEKIGPVMLFSPIYDITHAAKRLHARPEPGPQTPIEWDQFYWAQYLIAYRNQARMKLSGSDRRALVELLENYTEYPLDLKAMFYQNRIAPRHLLEDMDLFDEGLVAEELSACGKLGEVVSPVFLLHDANDQIVPPSHSRGIYAELTERGPGYHQELLITSWLSHVMLRSGNSLAQLFKMVQITSELFR